MDANRIARSSTEFANWAESVKLEIPDPIEQVGLRAHLLTLPDTLKDLVRRSKTVPAWVRDSGASQYAYARRVFQGESSFLPCALGDWFGDSTDSDLSEDLECSLVPILGVTAHDARLLQHQVTRPNDADYRIPLDNLTSYLWNYRSGREFVHRAQCAVQLPCFGTPLAELARPDSTVFFQINNSLLSGISYQSQRACASIASRKHVLWRYVLHWVAEYKGGVQAIVSMRQTWMGIVSGLYQRRSLGFKDQYVFGAAHYSNRWLTIFAGTWIDKADQGQGGSTATEKIIIYTLAILNMASGADVLQYYLLMRATRCLALDYRQLIEGEVSGRVGHIMEFGSDVHSWPPLPETARLSSAKRPRIAPSLEEQGNRGGNVPQIDAAAVDDCVQQSVHDIGANDPFIRRFAEELKRDGGWAKVRGYLESSIHDDYDYQVDESDGTHS